MDSYEKLDIGRNKESIDWCISRKFYKHDSEIKSEQDLLKCKNFEKYCKFVRNRSLLVCMQDENNPKEVYLKQDCYCNDVINDSCVRRTLREKSLQLLSAYKTIPPGSYISTVKELSLVDLYNVRLRFIEEHNRIVSEYREIDKENVEKYIYI